MRSVDEIREAIKKSDRKLEYLDELSTRESKKKKELEAELKDAKAQEDDPFSFEQLKEKAGYYVYTLTNDGNVRRCRPDQDADFLEPLMKNLGLVYDQEYKARLVSRMIMMYNIYLYFCEKYNVTSFTTNFYAIRYNKYAQKFFVTKKESCDYNLDTIVFMQMDVCFDMDFTSIEAAQKCADYLNEHWVEKISQTE